MQKDIEDLPNIKQYALNNDDWDWSLVTLKNPYHPTNQHTKTLQERLLNSYIQRGLLTTLFDGVELVADTVIKRIPKQSNFNNWYFGDSHILFEHAQKGNVLVDTLLGLQRSDGEFQRWDLILQYLCHIDVTIDGVNAHSILDRLYERKELRKTNKVRINRYGEIVSGIAQFGQALASGKSTIPVDYHRFAEPDHYTLDDLKETGITENNIKNLQSIKEKLYEEKGLYFFAIIWGPAYDIFDKIESEIRLNYHVRNSTHIDAGDDYPELVRQLYAVDDVDQWKVETKVGNMEKHPNVVRVLELDIPNPNFRKKSRTNSVLSEVGVNIKDSIRKQFWKEIDGYEYDIIIHICDNYHHNRETRNILRNYT